MRRLGVWTCVAMLGLGCGPEQVPESSSRESESESEAEEVPESSSRESELGARESDVGSRESESESDVGSREAESESDTEAEALAPSPLDLATVRELTVKVLVAHDDHWVACGIIHSTGYVEVEVLGAGEPRPRLALLVSCPVDFGNRMLFSVGNTVRVTLHEERQRWPTPPTELPADLPIRQVRTATEATGPVEPPR